MAMAQTYRLVDADLLVRDLALDTRQYIDQALDARFAKADAAVESRFAHLPGDPSARLAELEALVADLSKRLDGLLTKQEPEPVDLATKAEVADLRQAVESWRAPRDGVDGKSGEDGAPGANGRDGADGKSLTDAFIDHAGALVLVFDDGRTKSLRTVVGTNGRDGKDGTGVDPEAVSRQVVDLVGKALDSWPRPKDGADGAPGLGFDDMAPHLDARGRLYLRFSRGDKVMDFRVPSVTDQGGYKPDEKYLKGDGVTYNRSFFIAQVDFPSTRPETSKEWRLAVARGRDGKDRLVEPPPEGGA